MRCASLHHLPSLSEDPVSRAERWGLTNKTVSPLLLDAARLAVVTSGVLTVTVTITVTVAVLNLESERFEGTFFCRSSRLRSPELQSSAARSVSCGGRAVADRGAPPTEQTQQSEFVFIFYGIIRTLCCCHSSGTAEQSTAQHTVQYCTSTFHLFRLCSP